MSWYPAVFRGGVHKKDGDSKDNTVTFEQVQKRENIASGEKHSTIFSKIAKYFADLKNVAFSGNYNDLSNKPQSLPASDVYSWAKQPNKPSYNASEVGAAASNHIHSNYITGSVSSDGYTQVGAIVGARDSAWLQLPANNNGGLLPCTATDTSKPAHEQGQQHLGNQSWRFAHAWINKVHAMELISPFSWLTCQVTSDVQGTGNGTQLSAYALFPLTDNFMTLGNAARVWNQIYATNTAISTSDRRKKKEISYIGEESGYDTNMTDETLITFMRGLRAVIFKRDPNDNNRPHHGFIAQDFEELMQQIGLTDHAAFIKSPKTKIEEVEEEEEVEIEVLDPEAEDGKRIEKKLQKVKKKKEVPIPNEYIYGLRYEELISDTIRFTQILYNKIENREREIEQLKQRLEALESTIKGA